MNLHWSCTVNLSLVILSYQALKEPLYVYETNSFSFSTIYSSSRIKQTDRQTDRHTLGVSYLAIFSYTIGEHQLGAFVFTQTHTQP